MQRHRIRQNVVITAGTPRYLFVRSNTPCANKSVVWNPASVPSFLLSSFKSTGTRYSPSLQRATRTRRQIFGWREKWIRWEKRNFRDAFFPPLALSLLSASHSLSLPLYLQGITARNYVWHSRAFSSLARPSRARALVCICATLHAPE